MVNQFPTLYFSCHVIPIVLKQSDLSDCVSSIFDLKSVVFSYPTSHTLVSPATICSASRDTTSMHVKSLIFFLSLRIGSARRLGKRNLWVEGR